MHPHIRTDRDSVILTCEICRSHARMTVAEAKALAKRLESAIAFASLAGVGSSPPASVGEQAPPAEVVRCPAAPPWANELRLLLTVARVLRARLPEMAPAYVEDDLAALNEALAPFDPIPGEPINEKAEGEANG